MFDETLRYLRQLEQQNTYTMKVLPDEEGFLDKECPKKECMSKFKVNAEDWEDLFSDEAVFCPFCGHSAPSDSWWTTEQIEQLRNQAIGKLETGLTRALQTDARAFNRSQKKNSFIKLSLSVKGRTSFVDLPAQALEVMEQKIQCEKCGARYAVIGSAFYCPCCGENSAKQTFANTLEKVDAKIQNLSVIRAAISKDNKDDAERICNSLIESSVPDLVVAMQRLCECVYPTLNGAVSLQKNVFQRLNDGNLLWKNICGYGYCDWLTEEEYHLLQKCFQQRHLLQHKDGVIDQEYLDKSGDTSYMVGQHLIIREQDVLAYSRIIKKIGDQIIALA